MSDIDQEIAALKERVSKTERSRMLAEVKAQQAEKLAEETSALLKEKFGVESIEEAKSLLISMQADLQTKIKELKSSLEEVEGSL